MSRPYAPLFRAITTSERLANLPNDSARLFYSWLLTVVDDWGRVTANPRKLNALVWPMLAKSPKDTEKALEALRLAGLITVFPSEDGPFVQIPDHEDKSGSVGKRDHRRASHWPETASLAPLGPDWPEVAQAGPDRPSRTGAHAPPPACGASSEIGASPGAGDVSGSEGKSAEKGTAANRLVSDFWCDRFLKIRGAKYLWQGQKDGALLSRLMKATGGDVAEIQSRIERFLTDPFWSSKADWGKFCSQYNAMAGNGKPVDPFAEAARMMGVEQHP